MTRPKAMETMQQAIERLEALGFTSVFRALPGGRLGRRATREKAEASFPAQDLTVEQIVRFEGESDPGDEAVLFALSTPDDERGLFVASYGPQMEAASVAVIEKLDARIEDRTRGR